MKIKVSEASGPVLDWMVATCEADLSKNRGLLSRIKIYDGTNGTVGLFRMPKSALHSGTWYKPSTDWSQGGPIIEREEIGTERRAPCMRGEEWEASGSITAKGAGYRHALGPTPLIAAMRCYVASKLGEEVEVPDELL